MTRGSDDALRRELRTAGLSSSLVDAAWPVWRADGLPDGPSADAELRFALSRRLGLSPQALLDDRVEFVWRDTARFKHLTAADEEAQAALNSFGVTIGRALLAGVPAAAGPDGIDGLRPGDVRRSIMAGGRPFVDLAGLVSFCWAVGVPVVHLRVFPLRRKSMHAMVVRVDGRYAVLLGRVASYPAQTAFTLAHELGHAALGHLSGADAIVDLEDPQTSRGDDGEEAEADRFALEALTGAPEPVITTGLSTYNAPTLADAVLKAAPAAGVEPGTVVLCLAHETREWAKAMSALRFVYGGPVALAEYVNAVADTQLDWDSMTADGADYLRRVLGLPADAGGFGGGERGG